MFSIHRLWPVWQTSTFWTLLRITMKPCGGGCFRIRIFFPWSSTGYILLWHNGFILADLHGERCTNELQVQGEMHSLRSEHYCSIPETGKQAALSWVISISVITHQHIHKQTRNKSWLHVHTSNVVVNTGSQKTNQPHSKENSNGWIQSMVFQHKPFLPSAKCVAIALHYEYFNSHALQRHLSSMQIKLNLQYTF